MLNSFLKALQARFAKLPVVVLAAIFCGVSINAHAEALKPYKDRLFRYKKVTETLYDGDFIVVEYIKQRDLHGRDQIPERQVYGNYVSYKPKRGRGSGELKANGRTISYMGTGKWKGGAKTIVIYIHGQGGNRFQGMNDVSFGGNFNRIQNLMVRNGGAYLTVDVTHFDKRGTADVAALIQQQKQLSPGAKVVVACGSMGGIICWNLVKNGNYARLVSGIMLLGSPKDPNIFSAGVLSRNIPIYMGQGTLDRVYNWETQAQFFKQIKSKAPNYPIKFTLFDTGTHGTPIRMTDWRLVLNWMLG
ncbi:alpha/beta hydrolase [Labrenzia sp. R4_1]|uniref:alpha/beta hydrolase n=1 Tax=Labrenzia sp. R4_1 TaxID=2821106 RepID=UPI001ADC8BAA|nr:alpha/beta hydrolase [Labrenzia sp. R4_1]MBO9424279.1 alpha/beta hydrolase [Labrenzia sp. R4_1]